MSISSPCNAAIIKQARATLGWSQEELAARAGLSLRVVAKAEGGGAIKSHTALAIATAFSRAGVTLTIPDILCNPAALGIRFLQNYTKYQADCVQHSLDIVSPDIVAYIDGDPATNPIAGEYRGIEEFDGFFRKFFRFFVRSGGNMDNPEVRVIGNEVVLWGHEIVHLPEIPSNDRSFVMLRMRFEKGLMVRFEDYYEVNGMMRALHHFADEFPDADWVKILREKVQ